MSNARSEILNELKIVVFTLIGVGIVIALFIKHPWLLALPVLAMALWYLVSLIRSEYSCDARIFKLISDQINARELVDEASLIARLSGEAGVPIEFARDFLSSIASSFGAEVGRFRLDDRFDRELSAYIPALPPRLRKKVKSPSDYTDAGNFGEFICWEWYTDRLKYLENDSGGELERVAANSQVTIVELCLKLYTLEKSLNA